MHKVAGDDLKEIVMQLKDFHEKVLQAHVAAIKAAHAQTKERNTKKSPRSSAAAS